MSYGLPFDVRYIERDRSRRSTVDVRPKRADLARQMGAPTFRTAHQVGAGAAGVSDGFDVVIEAAGSAGSGRLAAALLAEGRPDVGKILLRP